MFVGSRKVVEHVAVHDPLDIAGAVVVRWRGHNYENMKSVGGVQADGLALVLYWCSGVTESEDERRLWHPTGHPGTDRESIEC